MKTMKLWRIAFVMLAAFSLTSCSNDDEDFDANRYDDSRTGRECLLLRLVPNDYGLHLRARSRVRNISEAHYARQSSAGFWQVSL